MSTKHTQLLSIQNSVEETPKSNSNYERKKIENTPFWIIGDPDNGYNLIMGKWKLTPQTHKTKYELMQWMNKNKYNLILSMIICATQDIHDLNNENSTTEIPQIIDPITRKIK